MRGRSYAFYIQYSVEGAGGKGAGGGAEFQVKSVSVAEILFVLLSELSVVTRRKL